MKPNNQLESTMLNYLLRFLFLSFTVVTHADIYSWIDEQGNRIYSDQNPAGHSKDQLINSKQPLNVYQPPRKPTATTRAVATASNDSASSLKAEDKPYNTQKKDEKDCQQTYGLSCDRVNNWQQYARDACGDDPRCDDSDFLARKYKPVPLADIRRLAQRNASRRNNDKEDIELFIRQRYSDYCEQRRQQLCKAGGSFASRSRCEQQLADCSQNKSLNDILAQHHYLTPLEKQRYVDLAKQYQDQQRWQKLKQLLQKLAEAALIPAAL